MNVIIAGAGEVGGHAAEVLSQGGHNVTVIDVSADLLHTLSETLDLRTYQGHCAHLEVLQEAGAEECDLLIAATRVDEINMLCASLAKAMGTKKTLVRAHHTANFALRGTVLAARLGIDELLCPEQLTALAVARLLRNPGAIAIEEFGRRQVVMERVPVGAGAAAAGKKLSELELPGSVRVATIEHNGGAVIANAESVVSLGDTVTLFGEAKRLETARKIFQKDKAKHLHIAILGDTPTAVWLCRALKSRIFSVRLYTLDHQRAEELSGKLEHVTVLHADPTDAETFAEERISDVDAFIAATADDERNILACAQAKSLGVSMAIAVLARSTYFHLLPHVGIDHAFSPRSVAVRAIMNLIEDDPVHSLAVFAEEVAEVYEVRPTSKAKVLGKELRNIKLPEQTMIAAIRRGDDVSVPGATDTIDSGDILLVIGPRDIAGQLRKLFVAK